MGFSFRRSASFGPFRLNLSKSGIGASVGVRGARLTMSPKGRAYITVGAGGFSYRQNLTSSSPRRQQAPYSPAVAAQPAPGTIVTAEVEQLLQSSRGELVETLNHRARMFNPATALFLLAAVAGLFGIVQLQSGTTTQPLPPLPDTSVPLDASRQANQIDEYALFIARYGQPSSIQLLERGTVPERIATFNGAHLNVTFVPVACVDAYSFYEAHKSDGGNPGPHRLIPSQKHAPTSATPPCIPWASNATTVVGYRDTASDSPATAATAASDLALLTVKSSVSPTIQQPIPAHSRKGLAVRSAS